MADNRNNTDIAAPDMLNGGTALHTVVWSPTEPAAATRPLLLTVPNPANPEILAEYYTFGFDQVKNVTELFDASGNIAASYEYAPFGATLSASGPAAALNPFRFSSEAWDAALGLVCYTFRPYNPLDGRFISRDPIEERGGLNLYGFAGNDPVNGWDYLGLVKGKCCGRKKYNPTIECCCETTKKIFGKGSPFKWEGMMALTEFGYWIGGFVLHCELDSNLSFDCKRYQVGVTALLGGVGTSVIMGGVVSSVEFTDFPLYPDGFKGHTSVTSAGAALMGGLSISLIKVGEATTYSVLSTELGVEVPGIFSAVGYTINLVMKEIPCENW
jgi:RHS repeat-associated protein